MPPRKRTSTGGSKKSSNQNQPLQPSSQPSKFGIQHFFERHTQNSLSQKTKDGVDSGFGASDAAPNNDTKMANLNSHDYTTERATDTESLGNTKKLASAKNSENAMELKKMDLSGAASALDTEVVIHSNSCRRSEEDLNSRIVEMEKSVRMASLRGSDSNNNNNTSHSTHLGNSIPMVVGDEVNEAEVTPETCKLASVKRFKFSPGMLIMQSQDDGGDEVTWKISPVNERLNAVSKAEKTQKLAECSRFNLFNFQQCSQKKVKSLEAAVVSKWQSSPPTKKTETALMDPNKTKLAFVTMDQVMDIHAKNGRSNSENDSTIVNSQSPFKTPPSLTIGHEKPEKGFDPRIASDQRGSRHKKKALIDLLDQVEDVITVESLAREENTIFSGNDMHGRPDPVLPEATSNLRETSIVFLVLEVSEKHELLGLSDSKCSFKVLRLLNEQSGEERVAQLWDEWFYSVVAPGDTVHVIGEFDVNGTCDVNHDKNFLIVHPDILVSGTRVAASFSCSRRTVLDERLKSIEYSAAALMGTLLHQIFQAGLTRESPTKEFLEEYAQVLIHKNLESLYACKVGENETHTLLVEAIPKILNWINLFRDSEGTKIQNIAPGSEDKEKKIKILEVLDIEEMAWAPKYGLKGMIDASVKVNVEINNEGANVIVPLEFKSGKGTTGQAAMEHNAQVMIYTILMSERYSQMIDYGLLYYLHTDQTQGMTVQRSDLVGLLMRRNELANDLLRASTSQQLPPMIQSPNICKGCRHLNACSIYHKAYGGTTNGSGLGNLFDSLVEHLTTAHATFLQKWDRLIDLEAKEAEFAKKEIWSSCGSVTEDSSSSLSSLVMTPLDKKGQKTFCKGNRFVYHFVHQSLHPTSIDQQNSDGSLPMKNLESRLRIGDYVILSTQPGRLLIASGIITDISNSHVSVSFSKRLRLPGSRLQDLHQQSWRIDKDEATSSFPIMRFNLVQLFMQNEESKHLRKMIVDLKVPIFDSGCIFSQDPAISYIWSEKTLNGDQRGAILKILAAKDYALILGMPGTGKTSTMVHAVKALLMRGASILLTSYTNSAVDNLLLKLKAQDIDFIRIGRNEAVHEDVREYCLSTTELCGIEDVKQRLEKIKVVGVTCLGITSPLLAKKRFDVCIMDEAGQTTLPVSLGPLMFASKFVLVGDHYQLPPLVQSSEAKENGMAVSLFCRLSEAHPQAISALQSQYRMCKEVMELSNTLIYGNRLRCGSSEVENAKLTYSSPITGGPSWMKEVMNPAKPVIFINTDPLLAFETNEHKTINNPMEAFIIAEVTNKLLKVGISQEDMGIITPYNSQADLIRQFVSTSVEIHTIDKYQGRDKDCILVSFVRSNENPKGCASTLLGDWHRINVALTRAKKKLIMVGSCATLSKVPLLRLLIETIEKQNRILNVTKTDIHQCQGWMKRCSQIIRSQNGELFTSKPSKF